MATNCEQKRRYSITGQDRGRRINELVCEVLSRPSYSSLEYFLSGKKFENLVKNTMKTN